MLGATNLILGQIEPEVLEAFAPRARRIDVAKGAVLAQAGAEIEQVYFPETAVLAIGSETIGGEFVNVVLVGAEGAFGAFEACGSRQGFARVTVQIPGSLWRLPAPVYRELFDRSPALRTAVHKYFELLLVESRQFIACTALHTVDARTCRTILELLEKSLGTTTLPITQEQLAQVLGVQRTTVAAALATLQRANIVRCGRGSIEVINRSALERAACSCSETVAFARKEIHRSPTEVCEA